jgi:hypothetical protein
MANKHKNMYKNWREDWLVSDWHYRENSPNNYAVTHKTRNKLWEGTRLGSDYDHERIWNE